MLTSLNFDPCLTFHQEHAFSMPFGHIIVSATRMVTFSNIRAGSAPTVHNNSMALIIGKPMLLLFIGVQFEWSLCFPHFWDWNHTRLIILKPFHKPLWMMMSSCKFLKDGFMITRLGNFAQTWRIQHLVICSTAFDSKWTYMESSRPPSIGICISNKVISAVVLSHQTSTLVF